MIYLLLPLRPAQRPDPAEIALRSFLAPPFVDTKGGKSLASATVWVDYSRSFHFLGRTYRRKRRWPRASNIMRFHLLSPQTAELPLTT